MNLTDDQKQMVSRWISQGLKLAEIQKRLETDCGLRLTYMEVKLLVGDLNLIPKDPPSATPAPSPTPTPAATRAPPTPAPGPEPGRLSVTVDELTRPGALVSGGVTFSDGQTGTWYLDEMGRLGLMTKQPGYKPSPSDVQDFQMALQGQLAKLGYG